MQSSGVRIYANSLSIAYNKWMHVAEDRVHSNDRC